MTVASKLPSVGTTIFTVMSKLAADVGAINLSQGFPDFDCDPELVEAIARHMREGRNQYAPMQGVPVLREAIAAKFAELYDAVYDPETEVTVTSGGTEAIFDSVAAVVQPGDEVIVFEPCYDWYVPAIELNGGRAVVIPLRYPEYAVPWDEVRSAVTPRTRMLMFNSPHNPTATTLSRADLEELVRLVQDTDILIVSDEVYEHIIFDGQRHESMARYRAAASAQLHRRIVWKDVPRHRLENRLHGGARGVDDRVPQGPSVCHVFDQHARCNTRWPSSSPSAAVIRSWRRSISENAISSCRSSPDRASVRSHRAAPTSSCWTIRRSPTKATWTSRCA